MDNEEKRQTIERYEKRYEKYGYDPRTLGWNKGRQRYRFKVLTEIGDMNGKTILDLGCGFGDLYDFLEEKGLNVEYTGWDITPGLIAAAKERHPSLCFEVRDILEDEINVNDTFDYVVASGIFNYKLSDSPTFIKRMMTRSFELCGIGISFDFMSSYVDRRTDFNHYSEPEDVFKIGKSLSRRVVLRHDYMPFEFAVYVYKDDSFDPSNVFSQWKKSFD